MKTNVRREDPSFPYRLTVIAGQKMKLIIGAGFLGSALAARLAGKEKIRVVNKTDSPLSENANVDFVRGDLKELDW